MKTIKRAAAIILGVTGFVAFAGANDATIANIIIPGAVGAVCWYAAGLLLKNDNLEEYE